jgi:hypothetical protein
MTKIILNLFLLFFLFKWVLHGGQEQRESKLTVLCLLIIMILINYTIVYYIVIKLLIMEYHPSQNRLETEPPKYFCFV